MSSSSLCRRAVLAAGLLGCLVPELVSADDQKPAAGPVIELPRFVVTDSRILPPPEPWRYARIEGFEVLSNGPDRTASRVLQDFLRFHQALVIAWPPADLRTAVPTALILCGKGGKFDAFKPKQDAGPQSGLVSLSLRDREMSAIVIDLEATTLKLSTNEARDAAASSLATAEVADLANTAAGPENDLTGTDARAGGLPEYLVDHTRQLYREYIHFVLSHIEPRAPAWLEEGLAQIFMRMEFTSTSIAVGNIDSQSRDSGTPRTIEDRDFNTMLQNVALPPLEEMFAVTHDSPVALHPVGSVWAKECYAFVHYCLYGDRGRRQQQFLTFTVRSSREPVTEAMFKECFGCSSNSLLTEIRGHINYATYTSTEFHTRKGEALPEPPKIEFRDATEAEVGRIKGDAFRLAGDLDAASEAMIAPYMRGERDPQLLAALGLCERAAGDQVRARRLLEAAVQGKAVRPRAYLELARMRYADALAQPQEAGGKFSPQQMAGILRPLFAARTQPPPLIEVYELIADTWAQSAVAPTHEHLAVVAEGVRIFLRNPRFVYRAAQLHAQYGFNREAAGLADLGIKMTDDAAMRQQLASLKASLPPLPATTPAAVAPASR